MPTAHPGDRPMRRNPLTGLLPPSVFTGSARGVSVVAALTLAGCAFPQVEHPTSLPTPSPRPAATVAPLPDQSAGPSASQSASPSRSATKGLATVVWIDDGDTVDLRLPRGRRIRVRLIGINAPEDNPESHECGGPAASLALRRHLPRGSRVRLVLDPTQDRIDRYGRSLGYLEADRDGRFEDINRWLVRNGHAEVYVYGRTPFERVRSYRRAQQHAQAHDLGVWACP